MYRAHLQVFLKEILLGIKKFCTTVENTGYMFTKNYMEYAYDYQPHYECHALSKSFYPCAFVVGH